MSANQQLRWLFGYGSLIWRPGFKYVRRDAGRITGFERRFWQGSTDHRGVPGAPGRVVTLLSRPGATCLGVAYALFKPDFDMIIEALDVREQGGYERRMLDVQIVDGRTVSALVYIATPSNPEYLGPAGIETIAAQVRASSGPSGTNVEYVLRLDAALSELGERDPHVARLARLIARG